MEIDDAASGRPGATNAVSSATKTNPRPKTNTHTGLSMTENYQKTDIPVGAMNKQEIPVRRICSTCDEIVEDPQVHLTVVDCPLDREHCQEQYKDKRGEVDYVKSDAVTYQIVNTYHGVLLLRCFHTAKPASKK
jgi:hypothetical protein